MPPLIGFPFGPLLQRDFYLLRDAHRPRRVTSTYVPPVDLDLEHLGLANEVYAHDFNSDVGAISVFKQLQLYLSQIMSETSGEMFPCSSRDDIFDGGFAYAMLCR
jgi:hypothetical protein